MSSRSVLALLAVIVGLSLVAAPVTMNDWGEQASHHVEPVGDSAVENETPVIQFESLSPTGQRAVRNAIESPDGYHVVYGTEEWPERFVYSDYTAPGHGQYVIVYEGQQYVLHTMGGGGFPIVYWFLELPFIGYGLVLLLVAHRTHEGEASPGVAATFSAAGVAFHLLGPEFGFPVVSPDAFPALGLVALVAIVAWVLTRIVRNRQGDEPSGCG